MAILLWMSFHPHHVFTVPSPSPPPAPKSHNSTLLHTSPPPPPLCCFCGRRWAFLSNWHHCFWCRFYLNAACWFYTSDHSAKVPLFFFKMRILHSIFVSYSAILCMMWALFFILTYMTTGVMGRNVLRLKRNVHLGEVYVRIIKRWRFYMTWTTLNVMCQ